jgi:peptide/nickel transport system permease protein
MIDQFVRKSDSSAFLEMDVIVESLSRRKTKRSLPGGALFALVLIAMLLLCASSSAISANDQTAHSSSLQEPGEVPVADAGPDMTVVQGQKVYFNAGNSTDDIGIVNYTWTLVYGNLNRTFIGPEFNFTFSITGTYNITLNVTDADGYYDTDIVMVEVTAKPVDYLASYWWTIPIVGLLIFLTIFLYLAVKGRIRFISEPRREKMRLEFSRLLKIGKQLVTNFMGLLGVVILVFFILLAIFGPMIAPYSVDMLSGDKFEKRALPSAFATDPPSVVLPFKLAMPLIFSMLITGVLLVFAYLGKFNLDRYNVDRRVIVLALLISALFTVFVLLHSLSVVEAENPERFNVLSAVGISATMVVFVLHRREKFKRSSVALALPAFAPIAVMVPLAIDLGSFDHLTAIAMSQVCAGVILIASGLLARSVNLQTLEMNPDLIAAKEGDYLRKGGRLVGAVGVITGSVMMVTGFISILQGSWTSHWMGTDSIGLDIYSELLYGARTSMIVGIISAIIASVVGAGVGLYSGYAGGWKDEVLMRANDVVLSIPWLVLMIIIAGLMGTIDLTGIILIIGLTGWSPTARLVRSQVLSLKERQYVERARAIGASDMNIIRRHILPNAFPLVFANTILIVAVSILSESTLSFLGMRPVATVTWGTMLSYASDIGAIRLGLHWWILAPGICIVLVVLGFTLVGYALDDILNPKLRKR